MEIKIKVNILDEDEITSAQINHSFDNDEDAYIFLKKLDQAKMQKIFNQIKAGDYDPEKLITGYNLGPIYCDPNSYTYNDKGECVETVYKNKLYDTASAACFVKTEILITSNYE